MSVRILTPPGVDSIRSEAGADALLMSFKYVLHLLLFHVNVTFDIIVTRRKWELYWNGCRSGLPNVMNTTRFLISSGVPSAHGVCMQAVNHEDRTVQRRPLFSRLVSLFLINTAIP